MKIKNIYNKILSESTNINFIGYHCSHDDDIGEDDFYGEITENYKDVVPLILSNLPDVLQQKIRDQVLEYNNYFKSIGDEETPLIDLNHLPTQYDDAFDPIMSELIIYINEIINGWVFVFKDFKETHYGNNCYKMYITNNDYTYFDDPNEFNAQIYLYYGNSKIITKKD